MFSWLPLLQHPQLLKIILSMDMSTLYLHLADPSLLAPLETTLMHVYSGYVTSLQASFDQGHHGAIEGFFSESQ